MKKAFRKIITNTIIAGCIVITVITAISCKTTYNLDNLKDVSTLSNFTYQPQFEELWQTYTNSYRYEYILEYWGIEEAASTKEIAEVIAEDFYEDYIQEYLDNN